MRPVPRKHIVVQRKTSAVLLHCHKFLGCMYKVRAIRNTRIISSIEVEAAVPTD